MIAATFLDSGNGLEIEILAKLLISPVPPETQNTKHMFAFWEFSPVGFTRPMIQFRSYVQNRKAKKRGIIRGNKGL